MSSVFVIIPVHNRKDLTLGCLANLKACGVLASASVVIVDDGSTDGTSDAIRANYPGTTILRGDGHLWWTGAIVLGMKHAYEAGAQFIVWLNDDCRIEPGALAGLVEFCANDPNTIVGSQGVESSRPSVIAFGGKRRTWKGYRFIRVPSGEVQPCDVLSGNLVCIPRQVVARVGYPDPVSTPHYGGDALYLVRARKAGFQLMVDARFCATNNSEEPRLYPSDWLLAPGPPWRLLQLVFTAESGLSWRVWLQLNWESYGVWGLVMFGKKCVTVVSLTGVRFMPLAWRRKLVAFISA